MKIKWVSFLSLILILAISSCTPPAEKAEEHYDKGKKLFFNNNPREALKEFQKGLEYVPDHDRLLFEAGNCYMNFRDYQTAIEYFNKAIESNPKFADAYFNRGQCWFYLNDKDKSCKDWKKADKLGKANLQDKIKHCN